MKPHFVIAALCLFSSPALALDHDMSAFPKWQRVLDSETVSEPARPFTGSLKALLAEEHKGFKDFAYVEDRDLYGKEDFWATRREFKQKRAGDCEDFAILGYFDLVEKGVPEDEMFVTVVLVKGTQEIHAYLTVGDRVLDQRAPRVMSRAEAAKFYTPIYSINRLGWKRG